MFDATRLLGGLIGGALPGTASKVLRQASRPRRNSSIFGGAAVPGGMLGLLGGLAIAAYEHYGEQQKAGDDGSAMPPSPPAARTTPPPPPGVERTMPPPPGATQIPPPVPATATADVDKDHAMMLIEAMIAAAKADGEVDATESRHILDKLEEAGASADERAWVMAELAKPLDVAAIVARVCEPKLALEVYAASLMAIEVDTEAERRYLIDLRQRLQIDVSTVTEIHEVLGVPSP